MKRLAARLALALVSAALLAPLSGCAALSEAIELRTPAALDAGRAVTVRRGSGLEGRAAVIGPNTIVTVAHVPSPWEATWVGTRRDGGWVEAAAVQHVPSHPESLIVLRVETTGDGVLSAVFGFPGFDADDAFACAAPGATPAWIDTERGVLPFATADLRPGDSGSPVLDAEGRLVGLLSGRGPDGRASVAPLPAGLRLDGSQLVRADS